MQELGLSLPYLVAGFAGGVAALVVLQVPRGTAALTVLIGALAANYLTAAVQHYLHMPAAVDKGAAFIVGIIAINIVKGIAARGEKWRDGSDVKGENHD